MAQNSYFFRYRLETHFR